MWIHESHRGAPDPGCSRSCSAYQRDATFSCGVCVWAVAQSARVAQWIDVLVSIDEATIHGRRCCAGCSHRRKFDIWPYGNVHQVTVRRLAIVYCVVTSVRAFFEYIRKRSSGHGQAASSCVVKRVCRTLGGTSSQTLERGPRLSYNFLNLQLLQGFRSCALPQTPARLLATMHKNLVIT